MVKQLDQKIDDLAGLRRGILNEAASIRRLVDDPARYEREREHIVKQIALFQKQLDDLDDRFLNGQERINSYEDRAAELLREIKLERNRQKLEKLLELRRKIEAANQGASEEE